MVMIDDKGIKLVHVNVRSIFRKLKQIELLYQDVEFLFCSETWLDNRYTDNMLKLDDMRIFRKDRKSNINSYGVKNTGGGVCIYVGRKFKDFSNLYEFGSVITVDYETISIVVSKSNFRNLLLICVYKPPKGKVTKLIDFLKTIMSRQENRKREIWILGDFNTDWLKRDAPDTALIMSFCKTYGLSQKMDIVTRPNRKGGSCIDLIVTNSRFVMTSGILDDVISDHYTIYCIRKKARESNEIVYKTVRDYSGFDKDIFIQLLSNLNWHEFDQCWQNLSAQFFE